METRELLDYKCVTQSPRDGLPYTGSWGLTAAGIKPRPGVYQNRTLANAIETSASGTLSGEGEVFHGGLSVQQPQNIPGEALGGTGCSQAKNHYAIHSLANVDGNLRTNDVTRGKLRYIFQTK